MEKKTILIQKLKEGQFIEKQDEVATEEVYEYKMENGQIVTGTCTPTYVEEMIIGSRFLEGDLTPEERKYFGVDGKKDRIFEEINIQEIFRIANECFEQPGSLFADTGCAHSCALVYEGNVICQLEDIGRHNAFDKVIGYALKHKIPLNNCYIFTSGRISKDYLAKAVKAEIPMLVSRAAVTHGAVELACEHHVTMIGFLRKNSGNLYCEGKIKLNG